MRGLDRTHYVPTGAAKVVHKATGSEAYLYNSAGRPCAVVFLGKAQKPTWHYRFKDEAARAKRIADAFATVSARQQMAADRRAKRSQPHKLQEGHILVASWGYDQTNIDWYQVTRVIGANTVEVREIEGNVTRSDGWASGQSVPRADAFCGEPMVKRVTDGDTVKVSSCAWARLWDGRPRHWTAYA